MSKGRVWITRAAPGVARSKAAWEQAGFECFIQPLISIGIAREMPDPLSDDVILLITSQNALRVLGQLTDRRDWPVMAVGDASANLARRMGFDDVLSAKGNGQDLVALVQKIYDPGSNKEFVYASGSFARLNIARILANRGYKTRRDIYYQNEIIAPVDLSQAGDVTHIALYSPMAAHAVRRYAGVLNRARTIAISPNADKMLEGRFINRRIIADRPNEARMIAAVLS